MKSLTKKLITSIAVATITLASMTGCTTKIRSIKPLKEKNPYGANFNTRYETLIDRWRTLHKWKWKEYHTKNNIKKNWSEKDVDKITAECRKEIKYEPEKEGEDDWKIYGPEDKDRYNRGDCEDIVTCMYLKLKEKGYPYEKRMRLAKMWWGGVHAMLVVELPNGKWVMYNPLPFPLDYPEIKSLKPLVEFNEEDKYFPKTN